MVTYRNDLSVTPISYLPVINLSQGDTDFALVFDLYSTVGSFILESGSVVKLVGTRSDGSDFQIGGSIDGYSVTINGNILLTAIVGDYPAEIVIEHSEKRLATSNFIISVEPLK